MKILLYKILVVDYVPPKVTTITVLQIALIYHIGGSHFPFSRIPHTFVVTYCRCTSRKLFL